MRNMTELSCKTVDSGLDCSWCKLPAQETAVIVQTVSTYGISGNLNGASHHTIQSETDIKKLLDDKNKFLETSQPKISLLLQQMYMKYLNNNML